MPHITIKMLEGRTQAQKELAVKKLNEALQDALGVSDAAVSVSIEDYTALEWQDVYAKEVANNPNLFKKPNYDPKGLL